MTANTPAPGGLSRSGKALGAVLLALFLSAAAVIAFPSIARADTGDVEYSSDGVTWGGTEQIPWNLGVLVPGQELRTEFKVRNASGVEGSVGFAVGNYTVTPGMTATARVDIDGKAGTAVTLTESGSVAPGTQVASIHLAPGEAVAVSLVIGMPAGAGNQTQNGHVNPAWAIGFTAGTLPEPGCVPSGPLGSLSCIFAGTGSLAS